MNEILILYILKRHDLTIYSLNKAIEELFYPYFKPSVGSISPILDKLSKNGYVEYSEKYSQGGMLSKKFSILPEGIKYLNELISGFNFSKTASFLKEVCAILIVADALEDVEKHELVQKIRTLLNDFSEKITKTIENPYIRIDDRQRSVYKVTKSEVENLIKITNGAI